jgi:molybdopterin/thiamine biosynthesis adenylyltransferase
LSLILTLPAEQNKIVRLDREYLLNRGGALSDLRDCCVAIAGCGAVGSYLAAKIASLGVGNIRLIDNDHLSNDNVHRHFLGVECLFMDKAYAMKLFLERRFPHLNIEYMNDDIIDILTDDRDFITGADLFCIALGHETLEMNINYILKREMPRIHAWVEPLGIGGHVFATGLSDNGSCFRCLFERDETLGLRNMSAFSAPGQNFLKTYAGCSGLFTPYSILHADRTALEAATLTADILRGLQKRNLLLSWYGDPGAFLDAGFRQTERIRLFSPGQFLKDYIPQKHDCVCRQWQCS